MASLRARTTSKSRSNQQIPKRKKTRSVRFCQATFSLRRSRHRSTATPSSSCWLTTRYEHSCTSLMRATLPVSALHGWKSRYYHKRRKTCWCCKKLVSKAYCGLLWCPYVGDPLMAELKLRQNR